MKRCQAELTHDRQRRYLQLRDHIKACELAAEKSQLAALERFLTTSTAGADTTPAMRDNLWHLAALLPDPDPGRELWLERLHSRALSFCAD